MGTTTSTRCASVARPSGPSALAFTPTAARSVSRIDGSFRIRYDGDERNGQAGKWLLETELPELTSSGYGTEIARQPTFNPMPALGDTIWNLKCRFDPGFSCLLREVKLLGIGL